MTNQEFVKNRLTHMSERPGMWAGSKEAFGLQLVLLAEVYQMNMVPPQRVNSYFVLKELYGPGNSVSRDDLDDEWARSAVEKIAKILSLSLT